jgi:ATP-dependent helicase/DNAse subunit B
MGNLNVILLPPGSEEERRRLLKETVLAIGGQDFSGIHYIAPTEAMLESGRRVFHEAIGAPCYIPPRITTLEQFSTGLLRTRGGGIIIPRALIPVVVSQLDGSGMGLSSLVAEFISEMKQTYPLKAREEIEEMMRERFGELGMPEEVSARALGALDTFGKYNETLKAHDAIDADDAKALSGDMIKRLPGVIIKTLILDGFYEITPADELLMGSLIRKAESTLITIPISGIDDDLSYCFVNNIKDSFNVEPVLFKPDGEVRGRYFYHAAPSMEEEVEGMARHIKNSFVSGRVRDLEDVYLLFPSLSDYGDMVGRIFKRYGIPCNMPPKPLSRVRPYMDLLALLEAVAEGYPRLPFSRALTSPYLKNIPRPLREKIPRICLDAGMVKGRNAWLRAFREGGIHKEGAWVFSILKRLQNRINSVSYANYIKVILYISERLGFAPSEDGMSELEGVLGKLAMLDELGVGETDLRGFMEAFRTALGLETSGEDAQSGGVRVSEILKARGLEPGVLYLGGLRDGEIPYRREMDFLLPDSMRGRLGMLDLKRHLSLQERVFRRITASAGELHMSYPSMEGEKFYLPSTFISDGECVEERVFGIFSEEEEMLKKGLKKPLPGQIREITGIKSFSRRKALNVTAIDAYRRCPRRFFVEHYLRLEPPEIMQYELEPRELGTILHRVMERLAVKRAKDIDAFSKGAAEALGEALLESGIDAYFKNLIRDSFMRLVPEIYELEDGLRSEGFSTWSVERKLEEEPVEGVRLRGKVDRIDSGPEDAVRIMDYKTSTVQFSGSRVLNRGENLQLPLYAAMLKALGMRPERVGVYSLREMKIHWLPGKRDIKQGVTLDDYISSSLAYLKETAAAMGEGNFMARPIDDQACRNCHERPYCPYVHGTGEAPRGERAAIRG